jgi:NAD(P)-dependent dehydrogenase (short-subunit alcohol dehydrogenase family)
MIARLSPRPLKRTQNGILSQKLHVAKCPDLPRLDGKWAAVTGANCGIGVEVARGLLQRGAAIIMLCRNVEKAEQARQKFIYQGFDSSKIMLIECDLADLDSVMAAGQAVKHQLRGRKIDILVENAAIRTRHYGETEQGHEIHFGTNVLGHFALRRILMADTLAVHARIIVVTDDVYVKAQACSSNYHWRSQIGADNAYRRSKLGSFWIARELQKRHPHYNVFIVHPGTVATELRDIGGWIGRFKRRFLISPSEGAQTTLICAGQQDLSHGSYYHNVHGECELDNADPATNDEAAARLWARCHEMTANLGAFVAIKLAS